MVFVEEEDQEEVQPKKLNHPPSTYVTEGKYYQKLSKFQKALACFEEGLELYPKSIPCLVGKATCLIRLGHYDKAKACADEAMKINPDSPKACLVKGDVEFYRGDFETSYQVFMEGSSKKPNIINLKKGHRISLNKLRDFGPQALSEFKMDEAEKKVDKKKVEVEKPPKSKRTRIPRSNVALFRRAHYSDIKFVEALLEDVEDCANAQCKDLWVYLNGLKTAAKYQNPKKSKKPQEGVSRRCLQECEKAYKEGDTLSCLLRGYQTLESLGGLPVQQRQRAKARVLHLMGLSCITRKDLGLAKEFLTKGLKISEEVDSPGLKFRSWRAIGEVHLKSRRFDQAKEAFRNSLQFEVDTEEEFLWREECYSLGKSVDGSTWEDESVAGECPVLDLDLQTMLAEIAMKERRINDAIAIYRVALKMATSDDDSRAEEVRTRLLELESMYESTDGDRDTTITDESQTTMVTCQEEISENSTNVSS